MKNRRVIAAMSGGVDSSVAALLLKEQGFDVIGITMELWTSGTCCSFSGISDARKVASELKIPHYTWCFRKLFKEKVIKPFWKEYLAGRTPNPCIICNREMKFRLLMDKAKSSFGIGCVATGHYARIGRHGKRLSVMKGLDDKRDQSYFLCGLNQQQLASILFPLGDYTKEEVRELARKNSLPIAEKPASQDICFAEKDSFPKMSPGPIMDEKGRTLGQHIGLVHYTIGQRKRIGLTSPEPLYVLEIDAGRNAVIVGPDKSLLKNKLIAENVRYMIPKNSEFDCFAKIRYGSQAVKARVRPLGRNAEVEFYNPQRAVTPGQAVVFYKSDYIIGAGTIKRAVS